MISVKRKFQLKMERYLFLGMNQKTEVKGDLYCMFEAKLCLGGNLGLSEILVGCFFKDYIKTHL